MKLADHVTKKREIPGLDVAFAAFAAEVAPEAKDEKTQLDKAATLWNAYASYITQRDRKLPDIRTQAPAQPADVGEHPKAYSRLMNFAVHHLTKHYRQDAFQDLQKAQVGGKVAVVRERYAKEAISDYVQSLGLVTPTPSAGRY